MIRNCSEIDPALYEFWNKEKSLGVSITSHIKFMIIQVSVSPMEGNVEVHFVNFVNYQLYIFS